MTSSFDFDDDGEVGVCYICRERFVCLCEVLRLVMRMLKRGQSEVNS